MVLQFLETDDGAVSRNWYLNLKKESIRTSLKGADCLISYLLASHPLLLTKAQMSSKVECLRFMTWEAILKAESLTHRVDCGVMRLSRDRLWVSEDSFSKSLRLTAGRRVLNTFWLHVSSTTFHHVNSLVTNEVSENQSNRVKSHFPAFGGGVSRLLSPLRKSDYRNHVERFKATRIDSFPNQITRWS